MQHLAIGLVLAACWALGALVSDKPRYAVATDMKTIGTLLVFTSLTLAAHATERWGVFELSLAGPASENPYLDVQWSARFTQGDREVNVPGFWDVDGTFKARFSPPTEGE
ncbi:MAG: DUF5060 domain-containing protein [Verrucomicrobiales bacterium]|nr:DUF5060 domain-containing protein [Verrucomicrobiales bacterium]